MNEHKFREYIYWGVTAVAVIVCCILVVMVFLRWNTGLRGGPYGECDPGADHLRSDAGISSDAGL